MKIEYLQQIEGPYYHVGELVVSELIQHIFLAVVFLDKCIFGEEVFLALAIFRCAVFFCLVWSAKGQIELTFVDLLSLMFFCFMMKWGNEYRDGQRKGQTGNITLYSFQGSGAP
jgi:hypothetical protein